MRVFLVKITNRENVDAVLNKQIFIHKDIYNFETEIKEDDHVFIYFSGDKSKIDWEQGLIGYGRIIKAPFDKGYSTDNPRYFKTKIKPILVLKSPIPPKETKLHKKFQEQLYDVPYVGANHFPNQAIARADDVGAIALFKLMSEYDNAMTAYFPPEVVASRSAKTTEISAASEEHRDDLYFQPLPKSFLLLAGISGTGKTRFVREQAAVSARQYGLKQNENYCLVPVRPDWHEPSDLLGYVSRIGEGGARFVVTDLLRFIAAAWKHAAASASAAGVSYNDFDKVCPFWLCLDEMNLAPVEQYFADYLSILETRTWEEGAYCCDPLLKPAVIQHQLDDSAREDLWQKLGINDAESAGLREYFQHNGIPLPPNLIVAGTVNMDETTHGFSRKVIDRALTIDFGEFFPNDYHQYYEDEQQLSVRPLGFPRFSGVRRASGLAGVAADPDGRKTIEFLHSVNSVLRDTPFELAYRALNEALLSVVCFKPRNEAELQAVWDDFLMMKVLPRIEGDAEKLGFDGDDTGILIALSKLLEKEFSAVLDARPDLLRVKADGSPAATQCRCLKKLGWMQRRLTGNSFTSFWP